jgi:hypothetical protein
VVRVAVPAVDADVAADAMWRAGAIAIEERDTPTGLLLVAGVAPGADIGRLLGAVDHRWPAEVVAVDIDAALAATGWWCGHRGCRPARPGEESTS